MSQHDQMSRSGPSSSRAPRMSYEGRHRQLLETAIGLLEAGGSEAVRMDSLARAAGVSRPVVYEHFQNREGLLVGLIELHGRLMRRDPSREPADADDFETELRASVRSYVEGVGRRGLALRSLMNAVGISPTVDEVRARVWNAAIDTWAERYERHFDLPPDDVRALAEFHLQGLWALAGRCAAGQIDLDHVVDLHTRIVMATLREFQRPNNRDPQ